MAEYHLHKWSVSSENDPWKAPEAQAKCLAGIRCEDDQQVVTSPIVSIEGRRVTTASGSVYILEDIDPDYVTWMKDNDIEYDPENPIRIKRR